MRTPGSGVALPGGRREGPWDPALGEGWALRELPRFQHGGDSLARRGGCEGQRGERRARGTGWRCSHRTAPHTPNPVPPVHPGTHSPSPVRVSVPPAPPRGHVADTSRPCHRAQERPRPSRALPSPARGEEGFSPTECRGNRDPAPLNWGQGWARGHSRGGAMPVGETPLSPSWSRSEPGQPSSVFHRHPGPPHQQHRGPGSACASTHGPCWP